MEPNERSDHACMLVGRFLYHFARVEQKIDQGVIKLFELDSKIAPAVIGSIDFAKKVNLVRTAVLLQTNEESPKKTVSGTFSRVFSINMDRLVVAHSSFEATEEGGVQFKRVSAKDGRVETIAPLWSSNDFAQRYSKMTALEVDLNSVVEIVKPYTPSLDFSDERNSQYLALL